LFCRDADRLQRAEAALQAAAARDPQVRARIAESAARLRAFRRTLGWCQPDLTVLRGLPRGEHQRLSERLLQPPPDSAVD
jgi:hypothetical protein